MATGETANEFVERKMREAQNVIQEATECGAIMNPITTDGYDPNPGGIISINIRINEPKLAAYREKKAQEFRE